MGKCILVTGGAGYIGSHTLLELYAAGFSAVVVDNYCNSSPICLSRVETLTGKKIVSYATDLRDREELEKIFAANEIDSVIHFAGLKAVGESVKKPLEYYDNNVGGTVVLLEVMRKFNVKKIVFSSSATVYGDPERLPIDEDCALHTTNPYGATKLVIENMLRELYTSDNGWTVTILRYFNPVGADKSGLIGEDPVGIPNNLTPYIAQVASGKLKALTVYGDDYDTPDGTGVRDYIHVADLAKGHVKALEKMARTGVYTYNLGTGKGYSVLDVLHSFEKACGRKLEYTVGPRRAGDIAVCYASTEKANSELNWKAEKDIDEMCLSLWNWQSKNPDGFGKQK